MTVDLPQEESCPQAARDENGPPNLVGDAGFWGQVSGVGSQVVGFSPFRHPLKSPGSMGRATRPITSASDQFGRSCLRYCRGVPASWLLKTEAMYSGLLNPDRSATVATERFVRWRR